MKMVFFWDVASYRLIEIDGLFRGVYLPDDGGNKLL
jgi:hypothetical protein